MKKKEIPEDTVEIAKQAEAKAKQKTIEQHEEV